MSRLRQLNDLINGVDSAAAAINLVKSWVPHQGREIDNNGPGANGVRNCSLIAEFVLTYMTVSVIDYYHMSTSQRPYPAAYEIASPYTGIVYSSTTEGRDFFLIEASGGHDNHDMALIRQGSDYGFYQAWDGRFHVFPKLNANNASYNVFGSGDATAAAIARKISETIRGDVRIRTASL